MFFLCAEHIQGQMRATCKKHQQAATKGLPCLTDLHRSDRKACRMPCGGCRGHEAFIAEFRKKEIEAMTRDNATQNGSGTRSLSMLPSHINPACNPQLKSTTANKGENSKQLLDRELYLHRVLKKSVEESLWFTEKESCKEVSRRGVAKKQSLEKKCCEKIWQRVLKRSGGQVFWESFFWSSVVKKCCERVVGSVVLSEFCKNNGEKLLRSYVVKQCC